MQETKPINYRGKVITKLMNARDAYKDKDKMLSGYLTGIIDDIMIGWEKRDVPPTTKK